MIKHCKIRKQTQTRTKRDKLKVTIFFKSLIRNSKQPLAIHQYQLLSSFVYL